MTLSSCKESIFENKFSGSSESQIDKIKLSMPRNDYPLQTRKFFIVRLRNDTKIKGNDDKNDEKTLSGKHYLILDI